MSGVFAQIISHSYPILEPENLIKGLDNFSVAVALIEFSI
jgi:hypothetical protein